MKLAENNHIEIVVSYSAGNAGRATIYRLVVWKAVGVREPFAVLDEAVLAGSGLTSLVHEVPLLHVH